MGLIHPNITVALFELGTGVDMSDASIIALIAEMRTDNEETGKILQIVYRAISSQYAIDKSTLLKAMVQWAEQENIRLD